MKDKILKIERVEYKSPWNGDEFRERLKDIFSQKTFRFKHNLHGKFINKDKFRIIDKITLGVYLQGGGDPAYILGEIQEIDNHARIHISARPSPIFPILGWTLPVIGFILIFSGFWVNINIEKIMAGLFLLFIAILSRKTGEFLKNRLLNKFERVLDLERQNISNND